MKFSQFSFLVAMTALCAGALPAAAPKTVRDGIQAWQRSDYASAVTIWRPLAQAGNPDAAFNLGQAYRLGRGVPVNLALAKSWLEKAAKSGHLDAQTTLGLLLFDSGNRTAAMTWLKKAAERGEPRAMLVYGTALFNGDGVPVDQTMAYAYVSRAAALGLEPAKATLKDMDSILPVDLRRKGVEIALQKSAAAPPVAASTAQPKPAGTPAKVPMPAAKKPVASVAAASPAPQAPVSGKWRVQVGAFSKRSSAEDLFKKLAGSSAVKGRQAYYIAAGAVTRLQVGPFPSRDAASAACASLKGQACFPVEAK